MEQCLEANRRQLFVRMGCNLEVFMVQCLLCNTILWQTVSFLQWINKAFIFIFIIKKNLVLKECLWCNVCYVILLYGRPCHFCNGLIKLYFYFVIKKNNLVLEECLWCNVCYVILFMADHVISAMD